MSILQSMNAKNGRAKAKNPSATYDESGVLKPFRVPRVGGFAFGRIMEALNAEALNQERER